MCLSLYQNIRDKQEDIDRKILASVLSSYETNRFIDALSREVPHKRETLLALSETNETDKCTAFYFGLEAFGKDFLGIEPYVKTRLAGLTFTQTQIMGFLAIAHHYAQRPIKSQAFAEITGIPKTRRVNLAELLPPLTRELLVKGPDDVWRTVHDLIAQEIIKQLLWSGSNKEQMWKQNLSNWAKDFAYFCRGTSDVPSTEMLELTSSVFIYRDNTDVLGTERAANNTFSHLIDDIPSAEGKIDVLYTVAELYPENAHFWAHLGRFYSVDRHEFQQAVYYINKALSLEWDDHILHHMKGMALRYYATDLMKQQATIEEILKYVQEASKSFAEARKQSPEDPYGYISEIQMLIRLLDHVRIMQIQGKHRESLLQYLQLPNTDEFLRECFGQAEELFEQVRRMREGEGTSFYEEDCRAGLNKLYGEYEEALQIWDNLLNRKDTIHPPLRRQIVWTYLARKRGDWKALSPREIERIVRLLEENLREEPSSDKNLSLWVQAIRQYEHRPRIEAIIERVGYWKTNSGSLDSVYYLYVLHMLQVLDGSVTSRSSAQRYMEECREMASARLKRNRTKSLEWLGRGTGIDRLVHHSELGDWDKSPERDFWQNTSHLARVKGRISKYQSPQAGAIEVEESGLEAFFVPARGDARGQGDPLTRIGFSKEDLNTRVDFYLGFSYDGLRAWEVRADISSQF